MAKSNSPIPAFRTDGHLPVMIENIIEYEKTQDEIDVLEERLRDLQRTHPVGLKGFTKAGIRKMIARLHEELAIYEASEDARRSD